MVGLMCISITKPRIITSSSLPDSPNRKPQVPRKDTVALPPSSQSVQLQQPNRGKQPSVAEVERAIGAGIFRDRDVNRDSEQVNTMFDTILSKSIGRTEGSVEKKLRETGEWIIDRTEAPTRSTGKNILKAVFLLVLPMWILSFLVASGLIKLPFSTPFLDDLLM